MNAPFCESRRQAYLARTMRAVCRETKMGEGFFSLWNREGMGKSVPLRQVMPWKGETDCFVCFTLVSPAKPYAIRL